MIISTTRASLIISLLLSSPCKDAYIIQFPNSINITEDGYIDVIIVDNDLNQYQTLYIDFDDEFTISDSHGKDDISGYTVGSSIVILANDTSTRSVSYHLPDIPSGSWSGSLGLSIRLDTVYPSNLLISGSQLNQIIAAYAPAYYLKITYPNKALRSFEVLASGKDAGSAVKGVYAKPRVVADTDLARGSRRRDMGGIGVDEAKHGPQLVFFLFSADRPGVPVGDQPGRFAGEIFFQNFRGVFQGPCFHNKNGSLHSLRNINFVH